MAKDNLKKEPLMRIVKRTKNSTISKKMAVIVRVVAILLALVVLSLIHI